MIASIVWFLAQAEGEAEPVNDAKDLYPHWQELLVGALAFAVLFFFVWKWVLPRVNALLDERRDKIQGDLERAEQTRTQAEQELADYRQQLANARQESNAHHRGGEEDRRAAARRHPGAGRARGRGDRREGAGGDPGRTRPGLPGAPGRDRRDRRRARGARGRRVARREVPPAPDRRVHRPGGLGRLGEREALTWWTRTRSFAATPRRCSAWPRPRESSTRWSDSCSRSPRCSSARRACGTRWSTRRCRRRTRSS